MEFNCRMCDYLWPHRQENWYHADNDALYTSRWWPNLDAEVERSRQLGTILDTDRVHRIMRLLKIGVKLGELRDDLHEDEAAELAATMRGAEGYIALLDAALHGSGLLQAAYTFKPGLVPPEPSVSEDMARFGRTEDFVSV